MNDSYEMVRALMRQAGRRFLWKVLINDPGLIGTIRTHSSRRPNQGPYTVAVLPVGDSPIAPGIELIEPRLLMLGDQALILRGFERLRNDEGPFTVLQELRCEPMKAPIRRLSIAALSRRA